jgi:multidrug resistance efflux pump
MPATDFTQYSLEIQDIIGQVPRWIVRWGISLFFGCFAVALFLTTLVRYPDIISARLTLTTPTPPTGVVARATGKIDLRVRDGQLVKAGQVLALIESSASFEDIQQLEPALVHLRTALLQTTPNLSGVVLPDGLQVGELQLTYLSLNNALRAYQLSRQVSAYEKQMVAIRQRIRQYQDLQRQLEQQRTTRIEDLTLADRQLSINRKLFADRVIAEVDFNRSQQEYLRVKQQLEATETTITNNQITSAQLEGQLVDLAATLTQTNERLLADIRTQHQQLESQLVTYRQTYWVEAPLAGRVTLLRFLTSRRFVPSGTELMSIVPATQPIYGQTFVPIAGSGKVEIGQRVNIKFDNFPYNEYGLVEGRVEAVSAVPRDGAYSLRITFPKGLVTNYRKQLTFRQEMTGTADIIAKDLSLFERIFYQIRSIFVRST